MAILDIIFYPASRRYQFFLPPGGNQFFFHLHGVSSCLMASFYLALQLSLTVIYSTSVCTIAIFLPLACHVWALLSQTAICLQWMRFMAIFIRPCGRVSQQYLFSLAAMPHGDILFSLAATPHGSILFHIAAMPHGDTAFVLAVRSHGEINVFFASRLWSIFYLPHSGSSASGQSLICFLCLTVICLTVCYIFLASRSIAQINIQSASWQCLMACYICSASQPCPSSILIPIQPHRRASPGKIIIYSASPPHL
jgi:hypothetical protein